LLARIMAEVNVLVLKGFEGDLYFISTLRISQDRQQEEWD